MCGTNILILTSMKACWVSYISFSSGRSQLKTLEVEKVSFIILINNFILSVYFILTKMKVIKSEW